MHLLAFAESIQLFPDGTLFLHVAMILIMIWVLNRTLYRPINKVLEAREKNKGGNFTEASTILADVTAKEKRYTSELLDARSRGYEMIENEQKVAIEAREKQLAAARSELSTRLETSKAELEKMRADAHATIGSEADKMADAIASSILKG